MKLKWMGRYTSPEQLPVSQLPPNAVQYAEPEDLSQLVKQAMGYLVLPVLLTAAALILKRLGAGHWDFLPSLGSFVAGVVLSLVGILPHELLHGLCYPRDAQVQRWVSPKDSAAFVTCTQPVSKIRFLWMCAAPNVVLGLLPLLIWVLLPHWVGFASQLVLVFGAASLMNGVGDYLNIHLTLSQVPRGAIVQNSGFHTYWYLAQ